MTEAKIAILRIETPGASSSVKLPAQGRTHARRQIFPEQLYVPLSSLPRLPSAEVNKSGYRFRECPMILKERCRECVFPLLS
jgi:hypothetical protein